MRRKWNLLMVLLTVLGMLLVSDKAYAAEAVDVENTFLVNEILDEYSCTRELEFLGITSLQRPVLTEESAARSEFIEQWKEELNIDIVSVDIEFTVVDTIGETDCAVKVKVYESVLIEYVCRGDDYVETMWFGTEHIVNISKEDGIVISDSYSEITEYETGLEEDLTALKEECVQINNENSEEMSATAMLRDSASVASSTAVYSAAAAIAYSNQWCGVGVAGSSVSMRPYTYNPDFYFYSGNDCCNFVSQCLYAGGMPMEIPWYATINDSGTVEQGYTSNNDYSHIAWRYVPSFRSYWEGTKDYTVERLTTSNAKPGNPVFWLKTDGYSTNHIMLIVATNSNGQILVNGHNDDCYRYPYKISDRTFYTLLLTQ